VKEKRLRKTVRDRQKSKRNARLAKVVLNFNKEKVKDIKGEALKDQVAYFRLAGANLSKASLIGKADDKRDALRKAIDEYLAGTWIPKVVVFDLGPGSDVEEECIDTESASDE
jgi:hypothetical protein